MSATSLRIEVEAKQGAAQSGSPSDSSSGKLYTQTTRQPTDTQQSFRDAIAKQRNERETAERLAEKARRQRIADDRQERDEAYLARQEAKAAKRQASEEEKRQKQQERDENYAERQELRNQKKQEADQLRQQKQQEALAKKAGSQQSKDEDYYERQQKRDQAARRAVDPQYLANQMLQQQQLRMATQQEYLNQSLGLKPGGVMSKVANTLGAVNNGMSRLSMAAGAASRLIGGLGFVAGFAHAAWKHAIDTLLKESHRVAQFSPALRMQELRNNMRNLRTDMQIANEYGAQMAGVQDRENRQENAWRVIDTKIASAVETVIRPFSEAYTSMLEWVAGTGKVNQESLLYLQKITKLNQDQLDAMGISRQIQETVAEGIRIAEKTITAMGSGDLDSNDPLEQWKTAGTGQLLDRNADNPGWIPNMLPKGWNE